MYPTCWHIPKKTCANELITHREVDSGFADDCHALSLVVVESIREATRPFLAEEAIEIFVTIL